MPKIAVLNRKQTISGSGLILINPPTVTFKIEVDLPKEIQKDPLLLQEFNDVGGDIFKDTVKHVTEKCDIFEKLFLKMIDAGEDPRTVQKNLDGLNKAIKQDIDVAEKAAEAAILATWKDLTSKKKEWQKFKIKIAASIVGTLASVTFSIASLAATPWTGGASAVLAITGFIKAGSALLTQIGKIAIDIDNAKKLLDANLAVVETTAQNKGLYAASEVTGAVLNNFLGVAQPTIKSVGTCVETFSAKYAQMVVKVHELSVALNKLLDKQEALEKDFLAEAQKKLNKHPTRNKAAEFAKIRVQFHSAGQAHAASVNAAIASVGKLYTDVKKWEPMVKAAKARVALLQIKDPKYLKAFRELLKLGSLGLAPISGNEFAKETEDIAAALGAAGAFYVYDKIVSKAIDGTVFDAA